MGDVVGTTSPACTPTPGSSAAGLSRTPHRRPQRYDAVCMHSYVTTQPSPLRYNTAFTVTLQHSLHRYVTTQPSPLRYNTAVAVTLQHSLRRYVKSQSSPLRYNTVLVATLLSQIRFTNKCDDNVLAVRLLLYVSFIKYDENTK